MVGLKLCQLRLVLSRGSCYALLRKNHSILRHGMIHALSANRPGDRDGRRVCAARPAGNSPLRPRDRPTVAVRLTPHEQPDLAALAAWKPQGIVAYLWTRA